LRETLLWLIHRLTGIALLGGLVIHFFVMHYSGPEQISHAAVIARLANPWWKSFDVLLLFSAVYHGYNGLWGIVSEYIHPGKYLFAARSCIVVLALMLAISGLVIITVP